MLAAYAYDGNGRLETVSYPDGTGYRYGYDSGSRIVWVKNALGEPIETHEYDAQGRAITSERDSPMCRRGSVRDQAFGR